MWEKLALSVTNCKITQAAWRSFLFYFAFIFLFYIFKLKLNPDSPTQKPLEGHACRVKMVALDKHHNYQWRCFQLCKSQTSWLPKKHLLREYLCTEEVGAFLFSCLMKMALWKYLAVLPARLDWMCHPISLCCSRTFQQGSQSEGLSNKAHHKSDHITGSWRGGRI